MGLRSATSINQSILKSKQKDETVQQFFFFFFKEHYKVQQKNGKKKHNLNLNMIIDRMQITIESYSRN